MKITAGDCVDTSACYPVTIVELIENSFQNKIMIYPNPANGELIIDLGTGNADLTIEVTDQSGKVIRTMQSNGNKLIKASLNRPAGIYFLNIYSKENKATFKVIKE